MKTVYVQYCSGPLYSGGMIQYAPANNTGIIAGAGNIYSVTLPHWSIPY